MSDVVDWKDKDKDKESPRQGTAVGGVAVSFPVADAVPLLRGPMPPRPSNLRAPSPAPIPRRNVAAPIAGEHDRTPMRASSARTDEMSHITPRGATPNRGPCEPCGTNDHLTLTLTQTQTWSQNRIETRS